MRVVRAVVFCFVIMMGILVQGATAGDYPSVKVTVSRGDCLFKVGDTVEFSVEAKDKAGNLWRKGKLRLDLLQDLNKRIARQETELSVENPVKIRRVFSQPGFIALRVTYFHDSYRRNYGIIAGAGAGVDQIRAASSAPADLVSYWRGEYEKLKKTVPLNLKKEVHQSPYGGWKYYRLTADSLGTSKIYSGLAIPDKEGKFPLMITVPPAGNWGVPVWNYLDAIRLTVTVFDRLYPQNKGYDPYYSIGKASCREDYFYYKSMLGLLRMIDYAKTLPQWDGRNIIAMGRSQGGGFAIITAALEPKVNILVADVPALCDHNSLKAGRMPGWPQLLQKQPHLASAADYFDAANFAELVKCPAIFSVGFIDTMCCPSSIYAAFNNLKGEKKMYTGPVTGHGWGEKKREFELFGDTCIDPHDRNNTIHKFIDAHLVKDAGGDSANGIRNGNFLQEKDGVPMFWWKGNDPGSRLDKTVRPNDQVNSFVIDKTMLQTYARIKGGETYRCSYMLKTEGFKPGTCASFQFIWQKKGQPLFKGKNWNMTISNTSGNHDWKLIQMPEFTAPAEATEALVRIGKAFGTSGRFWVADVKLLKVDLKK